ncbi:tRNA (adenosine(37)-N6)-threonylcarbamoyltransferase complex ATPase subunit type 1 TsaE [Granulicatella sp. zg-ZJ]|uniref:tRNA (adenosine(37)-N6)-threonylcarbamoyltransferase complex ATPase subunit type 1 TsaE n=1 Tax=unclassified Granulicatella TaxID=2630493 RepID=UPI0013BF9CBE|nr:MULTISPECIES: tRNA (adenosine(37)-N6)-threonylcarbamoyltransferase complex ATPase subunit type 1 TsaE [unclassified Granulicatella]MBS4750087.1 tRNA (adenosine(37)-N6)-threonylcarbamoyltransferase complex ATPase subunit type 1 TsaE [Carnobacteriaceae bacterium zg-ZUI78]NEW63113.1 tRNA (adenosine(37)-N6)-threonylcarbamoyltransferase complex ATPase subunit type 1 TsaE [Granulicatella sp. zg-ZJ]NEW66614.1 tRNA (adenosine(37)-N6)-threonylcarbamoyltransferase complex ATPase subunit type 1 TsaE [Gr
MQLNIRSEQQMQDVASQLAPYLESGMTILLHGELGAGKTTFTKGLAKGLGITKIIKSPTYTLIREYLDGRLPLYHMDVYRLEDIGGDELGFEEYFDGEGVCIVEWSQFIQETLPKQVLHIYLDRVPNQEDARVLKSVAHGPKYDALIQKWENSLSLN